MEDHKILITTSGLGSRLGSLTNHTNKSLVRIGDKPCISHILEHYGKDKNFVITIGHHGDKVVQFLNLVYQDWNFEFVKVDKYEGKGSSLGYSMSLCREVLDRPFIFHACDTIIEESFPIELKENWLVGCRKSDSSNYRSIVAEGESVVKIRDKGEIDPQYCYVGVAGIKDHKLFFEKLSDSLSRNEEVSDADVINDMKELVGFKLIEVQDANWFDIGNSTSLEFARKRHKSSCEVLDKNDESIFFYDNLVVKFFSDENINKNRVERARLLSGFVPKIIKSTNNFYSYEKEDGTLFSQSANPESFGDLMVWAKSVFWQPKKPASDFKSACGRFYLEKTLQRIDLHLDGREDETKTINGLRVPGVHELLRRIDREWISNGVPVRFHGDFILDNILRKDDGKFMLIDWRQDFNGLLDCGDLYYDISKLNHNLTVNHEIVNKGLYLIEDVSCEEKRCDILCSAKLTGCRRILMDMAESMGLDKKKIEVITSLIWLNMSGVHGDRFGKFLFNWGKYNLFLNLQLDSSYPLVAR